MVLRFLRHLPLLAALFLCNGLHGEDALAGQSSMQVVRVPAPVGEEMR